MRETKLDDWPNWDYEAVLRDNNVTVDCDDDGWGYMWKYGTGTLGFVTETQARKGAAMFVSLWLLGVSATFADKLTDGYLMVLDFQDGHSKCYGLEKAKQRIKDLAPSRGEEIIVTLTSRRR